MARRVGLAAVLVIVAALAGCAQASAPRSGTNGVGSVNDAVFGGPYGQPCDSDGPSVLKESLPPEETLTDGAHLTLATRCTYTTQIVPGDGEWSVRHNQQATGGLDALAAALRLPSEENPGLPCPLIGYASIVITVTEDTGRSFRPAIPHEACSGPLRAVTDAIAALPWTTTASTPVQRIRTELEVSSGCSGQYKPVVAMVAAESSGTGKSNVDTTARELRACRYELDLSGYVLDLGNGVSFHAGQLVAASIVDAQTAHLLLAAVAAAPAASAECAGTEAPFVVLGGKDGGGPGLTVEVGGCYRVLYDGDGGYVRQLDAATVTALLRG